MKADFERLLDEIGSLEVERQNLEMELERAKKEGERQSGSKSGENSTHGPPNNTSNASVERIKERFQKVKKELDTMREERKKKENAYRLMQRESKQCEALIKEIKNLKEGQVTRIKTQKNAMLLWQKKDKESQHKFSVLRKNDVKKQHQMNTLKSEIVKKDRVLGHKDREIGRINSKLRACEEHIAQLLKIQNRNRARLNQHGHDSHRNKNNAHGEKNAKGEKGGLLNVFGSGFSLKKEEIEQLLTGKSMLDDLVKERVEKRMLKESFDKKTTALQVRTLFIYRV